MTWVRKDDQMPIHRKVAPLSDAAYRLHDEALCWASRNLTDGLIGRTDLAEISKRGREKYATELVGRDLWHPANHICDACLEQLNAADRMWPADGWVIHDYLGYNPSRLHVTRERVGRAQRQQRWRDAKRNTPVDASRNGNVDALRNAPVDAAPNPARPAPKEAGRVPPRATAAAPPADAGGGQQIAQCRRHVGQPAHNCAACRSEQLGGVA